MMAALLAVSIAQAVREECHTGAPVLYAHYKELPRGFEVMADPAFIEAGSPL